MSEITMARQAARTVAISTPLGEDVLLFHHMTVTEALGRLFQIELDLLSEDATIRFEELLGQNVTIRLQLPQGGTRYFNGFVSRFSQAGTYGHLHAYRATVHPWLWFLTRTADCRIFEKATFNGAMTVPNIIKQVFREHGFTDFEEAFSGVYRTWDYCVQYRETDFNFVSRLMEQEGIYYYFKHEEGKHTLVFADSVSSHDAFPGYETIPYYPPDAHFRRERDHIYDWSMSQEVQPGVYTLNDFNFQRPRSHLLVRSSMPREHARGTMEIYDYPGNYTQTQDGEAYARARVEALQVDYEKLQGQANAPGLAAGHLFELSNYPRQDQNREYLIVSAIHDVSSDAYRSTSGTGAEEVYACRFTAIDSRQPYRPARTTLKPMVQGPQTATVVGPSGDEIYTDPYGRVKVRFHWDHEEGRADPERSCWIRVAQVWAGSHWGGIHIPRVGQEVVVEFLEGDPDQPIITGRVYNHDHMPPYDLPANATQSGIKSRSSKEGTPNNFNEIRFEDKKGEELVNVHAERNLSTTVEADESRSVGHDRSTTIDHDDSLTVKNNHTITVQGEQTVTVTQNVTETYQADHAQSVTGSQTVSSKTKTENIAQTYALTTHQKFLLTQGGTTVTLTGNKVTVDAASSITLTHGAGTIVIQEGGRLFLESSAGIELRSGTNSIIVEPHRVLVDGVDVTVSSGDESGMHLKGGAAQLKSSTTDIEAVEQCAVKGGQKLNLN